MPDFDFDAFNHDNYEEGNGEGSTYAHQETVVVAEVAVPEVLEKETSMESEKAEHLHVFEAPVISEVEVINNHSTEEVDKW